jgi:hypothetical protein
VTSNRYPILLTVLVAACARSSSSNPGTAPAPAARAATGNTPNADPRVGLKAGWFDAGEAIWNLRMVSTTRPSKDFINQTTPGDRRLTNSDLAFSKNYVIQGNYSGYQVWDIADPAKPTLTIAYVCPGSQSDVSVYRNLAFVSGEATSGRVDCGLQGVPDSVSRERLRGIRIFEITDIARPRYLTNVQTCRGSHTHTVVSDPKDPDNVYVYVSGSAPIRSPNELPGCSAGTTEENPNTALFRIEVIKVPLAHPEQAAIVSSPRIFTDLAAPPRHGENPGDAPPPRPAGAPPRPAPVGRGGPTQCHDITVYSAIGLAGGACGGYGLLLDVSDPANPKRIGAAADSNFSFWHSATFNNDGTKVLFTDEWGGGSAPRCRSTDKPEWGANAIFTLTDRQMAFRSYYKLPAAQTQAENCVAHNGSLIPIPGRDVMVQGWYQGGISVFDWTDPDHPKEIGFHDRGPMDATTLQSAGSWWAYWYNGYIVSSEMARGLDIFELKPSPFLSQNEIEAAKSVHFDFFNAQNQPKLVWPASFALARAYLDQLERSSGLGADKIGPARSELARAEKLSGQARRDALEQLATRLHADARGAGDEPKAHQLAGAVGDLSKA